MGIIEAADAGRPGAEVVDKDMIATKVLDTAITTGEATTTPRKEVMMAKIMAKGGDTGAKGTMEAMDITQNADMVLKNDI